MKYIVSLAGRTVEVEIGTDGVRVDGEPIPARLLEVPGTPVRLLGVGDEVHRVVARRGAERGRWGLSLEGWRFEAEALDERTHAVRQMTGAGAGPAGPAPLKAPMPGLVVRVLVTPGQQVQAGQGLVVMEAMKMENELRATGPGTVRAVRVEPGTAVEKGALLVELE